MELETVEHAVAALVALYEGTLDDYTQWQRRVRQDNHYRARDRGRSQSPLPPGGGCALSTSLRYSAARIRDTFANGADVLGPEFAAGDKPGFRLLLDNLGHLEARVDGLRRHALEGASSSSNRRRAPPLELRETLRASEAVRAATLRALAEQYHRVAVGRLASPRAVPGPGRPPGAAARRAGEGVGASEDGRTTIASTVVADEPGGRRRPNDEEEEEDEDKAPATVGRPTARAPNRPAPPSPPPTPVPTPARFLSPPPADDAQSTVTTGTGPRPRASVFSLFCPEAVKYQVDLTRATPRGSCRRCGYVWEQQQQQRGLFSYPPPLSPLSPPASTAVATLKEGFQLTPRFLGKSHCGSGDGDGGFSFACVLCTSRGASALYGSVAALRDHINLAHDKWQMLHERDLAAR